MSTAIKHFRKEGHTVVIEIPSKELLMELIETPNNVIDLSFGMTFLHGDDQYNYKLGRTLASSRMKTQPFIFDKLEMRDSYRAIVSFRTDKIHPHHNKSRYSLLVAFSYIKNNPKVRLEYAEIEVVRGKKNGKQGV